MIDKCAIARETADYLTPETWAQGSLLEHDDGQIGDEGAEVEFFKDYGTTTKWPVCLVGSLIRACYLNIPDYDWEDVDHHAVTMELAETLAGVIDPNFVSGAFGTITQFNDEDEYDPYTDESQDRFPTIKHTVNKFANKVCERNE